MAGSPGGVTASFVGIRRGLPCHAICPTDLHAAIGRGSQWGDEIPIGLSWRRTDLPTWEDLEPVLHTGEGPLAFRKIGIPAD